MEHRSALGNMTVGPFSPAGDPKGEVRLAWHAKETLRGLYHIDSRATKTPTKP